MGLWSSGMIGALGASDTCPIHVSPISIFFEISISLIRIFSFGLCFSRLKSFPFVFIKIKNLMPPKAAESSTKKVFFLKEVIEMVFSINDSPPSWSEIKSVMGLAEYDLDLLDGRELWVYQKYCQGGLE